MKLDISGASPRYQRTVRRWRAALLIVCAIGLVGAAWLGLEYFVHGSWSVLKVVAVSGLVVLAIAFGAVSGAAGAQPEILEVDSEGVRVRYRNGRIKTLSWTEDGLHFQIGVNLHSQFPGSRGEPNRELYVNSAFRVQITSEAVSAITVEARLHGLNIREKVGSSPGWTATEFHRGP